MALNKKITELPSHSDLATVVAMVGVYNGQNVQISGSDIMAGLGGISEVTGSAPLVVAKGTTTPAISIPAANGTTNGYLSSADWTTFNNKTSNTGTVTGVISNSTNQLTVTNGATNAELAIQTGPVAKGSNKLVLSDDIFTYSQPILVSATNIKTINGTTILGSGDIAISSGSSNSNLLSTNVYVNDSTNPATPADWEFDDTVNSFDQVSYSTTVGGDLQTVGISFTVPASGYIRIIVHAFIKSATSTNLIEFGLHNNDSDGVSGSNLKYGWVQPGIDNDFGNQLCFITPIWDIAVNTLVDNTGAALSAGDTCTMYLKGMANRSGIDILFQANRQNIGLDMATTTGVFGGPLTISATNIDASIWSENPGTTP